MPNKHRMTCYESGGSLDSCHCYYHYYYFQIKITLMTSVNFFIYFPRIYEVCGIFTISAQFSLFSHVSHEAEAEVRPSL